MQSIIDFTSILLSGNYNKAWDYIKSLKHLSTLDIYDQLLTPAMHRIGDLWENNEITVADEHIATATCDFVLSRLAFEHNLNATPTKTKKAMFLCLEGEQHYIGLKMAAQLFAEYGWETKYFGPNLPLEYALHTAIEWEPDVIGLSLTIVTHLPKLKSYTDSFKALPVPPKILIGSRLGNKYDLKTYSSGDPIIVTDLSDIETWLKDYSIGETKNAMY
ncbi:B12-binding domain-containing protein [Bacillus sp. D386]|uniref:cobalamin B12-binding domain-containing protein n=1 Tax=Bacillus sp. D386 TaxID=2587155 RepID=UPI001121247B|nr:B12-binding domain-containing protein [Bacillus sp. D386]